MQYFGEILSVGVAVSWTATALFAEVGSKRIGSLQLNVIRMSLSLLMLGVTLWWFTGVPYPMYADSRAWFWLSLSGFVGYVLGDYCLFNAYVLIGSRFGQLFMTLAPIAAAFSGFPIQCMLTPGLGSGCLFPALSDTYWVIIVYLMRMF